MPGAIERDLFFFTENRNLEFNEDVVEDHAMQDVDLRPRQVAAGHTVHRRPITGAPRIRKFSRIYSKTFSFAQRANFTDDAAAPIDDRAEHVEGQRFDAIQCGVHLRATHMISTSVSAEPSLASTQARAGADFESIHASHASSIFGFSRMSA